MQIEELFDSPAVTLCPESKFELPPRFSALPKRNPGQPCKGRRRLFNGNNSDWLDDSNSDSCMRSFVSAKAPSFRDSHRTSRDGTEVSVTPQRQTKSLGTPGTNKSVKKWPSKEYKSLRETQINQIQVTPSRQSQSLGTPRGSLSAGNATAKKRPARNETSRKTKIQKSDETPTTAASDLFPVCGSEEKESDQSLLYLRANENDVSIKIRQIQLNGIKSFERRIQAELAMAQKESCIQENC